MLAMREALRRRLGGQGGFSLIEVLVAVMVFGILAVGIAYSLGSALNLTRDARSREVAIHLASQEIDSIRSLEDIFQVLAGTRTFTIDGTTYTVKRKPVWDNSAGDAIQCGDLASGSGSFEFKRVEIEVTWSGQRAGSSPVYSDTIIAPSRRITDPALGTILVSVINAAGSGSSGIAVTATPNGSGATTPPEPPPATDSEGCSYVLKVTPGQYKLKVSKSGYVDVAQTSGSSESTITVGAGELKSVQFQFDNAANFTLNYAANYVGTVVLPSSTPVTASNTYGDFILSGGTLALHPFPSGYQLMAGQYKVPPVEGAGGCLSPDPSQWPVAGDGAVGARGSIYTAAPGETVTAPVEMGVVRISVNSTRRVQAVSVAVNSDSDDPGCASEYTLTFPNLSSGTYDLALPFGSWQIQTRPTSSGSWATITKSTSNYKLIDVQTRGQINGGNVSLDPRKVP